MANRDGSKLREGAPLASSVTMTKPSIRRLAAVMIADVAGYSRLMERDEAGTHARLNEIRAGVTDPAVRRHGGRIVRSVGDGLLVEFGSAMSALQAAIEIQRELAERNRDRPDGERIEHRIGINLGDILVDDNDIAGTGVNVAARLEALAAPGGIAISAAVREQVREDLGVAFVDAGEYQVKNISRPIRVFRVVLEGRTSPWRFGRRQRRRWVAAAAVLIALAVGIGVARQQWRLEAPPQSLVVLPFDHPAPTADALAQSLTRQLTGALSQLAGMTVIAPAVAARFADRRGDLQRVGRELRVRYAVDGRIEQAGDVVRVNAHLVDADNGGSLWNAELRAPASTDGTVPLALIGQLSDALRAALRSVELKRLAPGGEATSAHALALLAADELEKSTDPHQMPAIRARFERALGLDAEHVPALTGYAHALVYEADQIEAGPRRDAALRKADEASLRAVRLQPDNAEAWAARANVLFFRGQFDAAAEAVQRGLALNPYLVTLQSFDGQIHLARGRGEEALAAFERGIALNSTGTERGVLMHFRCRALLLLGRHAEAIDSCERGMAFGPEWSDYMVLAAAYALHGDPRRAASALGELRRLQPDFSIGWHVALGSRGAQSAFDRVLYDGLRKAGVPE
jgi:class 3 adenylate cyclase/TolB-like protein/tetratricopeptide (TPR) repeat protein